LENEESGQHHDCHNPYHSTRLHNLLPPFS
jgi:hypothetical protein